MADSKAPSIVSRMCVDCLDTFQNCDICDLCNRCKPRCAFSHFMNEVKRQKAILNESPIINSSVEKRAIFQNKVDSADKFLKAGVAIGAVLGPLVTENIFGKQPSVSQNSESLNTEWRCQTCLCWTFDENYFSPDVGFEEVGRTEVIWDNLSPVFDQKIVVNYCPEEKHTVKFEVYDVDGYRKALENERLTVRSSIFTNFLFTILFSDSLKYRGKKG